MGPIPPSTGNKLNASLAAEVVKAAERVLALGWDGDAGLRQAVRYLSRKYEASLKRIGRLEQESHRRSRAATAHHLNSYATKFCGVILAAAKKKKTLSHEQVVHYAKTMSLRTPCGEVVRVTHKPKKYQEPGAGPLKTRPIQRFGIINTARQRIVRDWLEVVRPLPSSEYACAGKGRDRAVKDLVGTLNSGGGPYVVLYEIKDFFPSITDAMVAPLIPLPHSVRENAIFIEKGAPIETEGLSLSSSTECQSDVPLKLPQGSLVAPHVASLVMHDLTKSLPAESQPRNFVDDGQATGTYGVAEAIKNTLISRAKAQPGGPLSLKRIQVVRPDKWFGPPVEYLGYRLKRGSGGKVRAVPKPVLIANLMHRIERVLKTTPKTDVTATAFKMADAWRRSQSAWDFKPGAGIFWTQVGMVALTEHQKYLPKKVTSPIGQVLKLFALKKLNGLP